MNALNHTADRIIAAKTSPRLRRYTIQVEGAKPAGPLVTAAVKVYATDADTAENEARAEMRDNGYDVLRVVRTIMVAM
ncbi:MAG: hypothetical protein AB7V08_14015 [Elusimicrobiales bacterium]